MAKIDTAVSLIKKLSLINLPVTFLKLIPGPIGTPFLYIDVQKHDKQYDLLSGDAFFEISDPPEASLHT